MAKSSEIDVTGVQTEDIRTREFSDFIDFVELDGIIVYPDNKEYVSIICPPSTNVITRGQMPDGKKEAESQRREELRKGFGISKDEKVVGVLFDKRDEWQCRKWLRQNIDVYHKVFVYPIDSRSADLVSDVLRGFLPAIDVVNNESILDACDEVIAFRYYHNRFTVFNVIYSDYAGMNKVDELK